MSDEPFSIPPVPLMTADKARDIGRTYQGFANSLRELGGTAAEIRLAEQRSQWWLTYAIALAQVPPKGH